MVHSSSKGTHEVPARHHLSTGVWGGSTEEGRADLRSSPPCASESKKHGGKENSLVHLRAQSRADDPRLP